MAGGHRADRRTGGPFTLRRTTQRLNDSPSATTFPDTRYPISLVHCLLISSDPSRRSEFAATLRTAGFEVIEAQDRATLAGRVRKQAGVLVIDLDAPGVAQALLQDLREPRGPAADWSLEEMERRHIRATLEHTGGNRREAALLLGIARSTLLAKLRRYNLDRPDTTEPA